MARTAPYAASGIHSQRFFIHRLMDQYLLQFGLPGLFVVAFLAATVLPVASEAALLALILSGANPAHCVAAATLGNTLGAITTWGIGRWGSEAFLAKMLRMDAQTKARAQRFFARYGTWSLLLAWAPVIGDPLCAVAGLFDLTLLRFVPPVLTGKLARYWALAYLSSGHTFAGF